MNKKIGKLTIALFVVALLAAAFPLAAFAEDFNVYVPVNFTNIPQAYWDKLYVQLSVYDANNQLIVMSERQMSYLNSSNNGTWAGSLNFRFNYPPNNTKVAKIYGVKIVNKTGALPPYDPAKSVTSLGAPIPAN